MLFSLTSITSYYFRRYAIVLRHAITLYAVDV